MDIWRYDFFFLKTDSNPREKKHEIKPTIVRFQIIRYFIIRLFSRKNLAAMTMQMRA